jgi:hypothetical protein
MLLCKRGDFQTVCIDSFRTLAFFAGRATYCLLPRCRRGGIGRRAGLKIQYWQQCVGSTPSVGRASALDEVLLLELVLALVLVVDLPQRILALTNTDRVSKGSCNGPEF